MARRVLREIAVLTVMGMAAAACSNGSDRSSSGKSPSSAGTSSAPPNPAKITGTVRLLSYTDGFDPDHVASFHEQYPNINLETAMGSNEEAVAKPQPGVTEEQLAEGFEIIHGALEIADRAVEA